MPPDSLLSSLQRDFLREFFARQTGRLFFLTGGTALAEYYFRHRLSEDIDLFTINDDALDLARVEIRDIARSLGASLTATLSTPAMQRFELARPDSPPARLDMVRDVDFQFGQQITVDAVVVDSLENMGANKITAIFGRTESKDFVDLYFLLDHGLHLSTLISEAKEKDAGLTEFWLAGMMRQVNKLKTMPQMLKPLDLDSLKAYFLALADEQFQNIRPPD
jgi:predicted nucleotidyltransferase component of viral defense system